MEHIISSQHARPRGFLDNWNPRPATADLIGNVQEVIAEFRAYLPLTIRQIFYRLVAGGLIGKTEKDYKRLCETLNKARRARMVPFAAIRDDGVTTNSPEGFLYGSAADLTQYLRDAVDYAGLHPATDQPVHQLVICEAAGMVPQLATTAHAFGVDVVSSGGFNSVSGKYELAEALKDHDEVTVWHLGDFDPSGVHVYQSLAEDVCGFADIDLDFRRLVVTPDQIDEHGLETAPPKATDRRQFDASGTVQAEALTPADIAAILQEALASRYDQGLFDDLDSEFRGKVETVRGTLGGIDFEGAE